MTATAPIERKAKDFSSDQEVRWCPGCGDYAILKGIQKALADLGARPENTLFVSGIGCAARFPYYMSTYGFHTIHGRAPAIATGAKIANPDLDVWVVTGDGDGFSIGGNHMVHLLRRNVDLQLLLFNNEIYGLTKGQYSPTSRRGTVSPSTPQGSLETPVVPCQLALGAGARFIARAIDTRQPHLIDMIRRAKAHKGTSFVEIFQNCVVFNDAVFASFTDKSVATEMQINVEHGKPLRFGADNVKGLRLNAKTLALEVVTVGENGVGADDVLVHDETNRILATMLAGLRSPDFPTAVGVLYCNPTESYETDLHALHTVDESATIEELLHAGATWTVGG